MRLGVLDVGSNSAHLQVVDSCAVGRLHTVFRYKVPTRLADAVGRDGALTKAGVRRVVDAVARGVRAARAREVAELIPVATATIRDAANAEEIWARVRRAADIELTSLSGEEEAHLTFLAVRRWLGTTARPLLLIDIGGASTEFAYGAGDDASLVVSLPLGAGRLTRELLPHHPAHRRDLNAVRGRVRDAMGPFVDRLDRSAGPAIGDVIGTSNTFKQLARIVAAPAWQPGAPLPLHLFRSDLRRWIPQLASMDTTRRARLPGVSPPRAGQILAGAIVAKTAMTDLGIDRLDVCPWALREGILLRRLQQLGAPTSH